MANDFKIAFRIPEFHGDSNRYPDESWTQHKLNMRLAYEVAGITYANVPERQKTAHLLQSLQGKARKFLELNPRLTEQPFNEVDEILDKRFGKPKIARLTRLGDIVQKPGEQVVEFHARLRLAAESISEAMEKHEILTQQQYDALPAEDKAAARTQVQYNIEKRAFEIATEQVLLPHFIQNLRPELAVAVSTAKPKTLKEALAAAEDHERYLETYGGLNIGEINLAEANGNNEIVKGAAEKLRTLNDSKSQVKKTGNLAGPTKPDTNETRVCHYCHRAGHLKRECRQFIRDQERGYNARARQNDSGSRPSLRSRLPRVQSQGPARPRDGGFRDNGKNHNDRLLVSNDRSNGGRNAGGSTWLKSLPKNGGRPPLRGGLRVPDPIQVRQRAQK
jgi:hypothetical protein